MMPAPAQLHERRVMRDATAAHSWSWRWRWRSGGMRGGRRGDELFLAAGRKSTLLRGTTDGSSARTSDEHFLRREALGKGSDGAPKERSRLRLALPSRWGAPGCSGSSVRARRDCRAAASRRASKELGEGGEIALCSQAGVPTCALADDYSRRVLNNSGTWRPQSRRGRPTCGAVSVRKAQDPSAATTRTLAFGRYGRGRFRLFSRKKTASSWSPPTPVSARPLCQRRDFLTTTRDAAVETVDRAGTAFSRPPARAWSRSHPRTRSSSSPESW